jgi:predicted SAM-dependent methyltransferase
MGKGAPLRWIENGYLRTRLHGRGVEIGGLWRKFKVPSGAKVWYVDHLSAPDLARHYREVSGNIVAPDIIADAEFLPLRALDFIIASHVLEHLPSPLRALKSWYEALRGGGTLLLKVPDKRFTFDRNRRRTSLQHLIEELENPAQIDIREHFADWVENVNGRQPGSEEYERELRGLMEQNYSIHYHTWIDRDLQDIIQYTQNILHLNWETIVFWGAHFYRKETVVVLRKS